MAMNCFLAAQCRINVCRTELKMLKIHTYVFFTKYTTFLLSSEIYIRALSALTLCALQNLHATLSHNKIYVIFVWTAYKTYSFSVSHAARVVFWTQKKQNCGRTAFVCLGGFVTIHLVCACAYITQFHVNGQLAHYSLVILQLAGRSY